MGHWDKFCLLMWKNYKIQVRNVRALVIDILFAVLVIGLFLLLRNSAPDEKHPPGLYPKILLSDNFSSEGIAYSPKDNEFVESVMNALIVNQTARVGKANAAELEQFLTSEEAYYGIQFDDNISQKIEDIKNITINLRVKSDYMGWKTESIYGTTINYYGTRSPSFPEGADPNYHYRRFDELMYALTRAVYLKKNQKHLSEVAIRRFPYIPYVANGLVGALGDSYLFGLLFMVGFLSFFSNMVKSITLEKEKQLKESMKIMGLSTWLHWTAWFAQMFPQLCVIAIIMTLEMKLDITKGSIYEKTNGVIFFLFIILFVVQSITFSFALSGLFSKANRAASLSGILWVLSMAPYLAIRLSDNYRYTIPLNKYLTAMIGASPLFYGFDIINYYETTDSGLQWSNLFETNIDVNICLGGIFLIMCFNTILYMGIALYLEQVFPGDFGVPQPWYFLFTSRFWFGTDSSAGIDQPILINKDAFEEEPISLRPGIKIMNLKKTFGGNDAVKGISLNIYEDQITVLLGHNGAGKTTVMSMLTGMFTPTSGSAIVNNFDIRSQIMNVRDSMGLCPQHNVLFDDLTVREHLYFFSKLKGCTGKEVEEDVRKFLKLLSLEDKANERSKALSGGMKRKLCVGIALCGQSKVIILDEPTAGMDPSARRFIWEFLQRNKKGRTILLSTHFMDEADLLGDRIAIMSTGELKCCGSSFFLKKKFGTGYRLIIEQLPNCKLNEITMMLRSYIPNIEIESNAGTELTYLLPEEYSSKFPIMLSEIEDNSQRLGIRSYGISLTDLEEVFMKVGTNETGKLRASRDLHSKGYTEVTMSTNNLESGLKLYMHQINATFLKKLLSSMRSWKSELIKIVLPVLYIIFLIYTGRSASSSVHHHRSRSFTLNDYNNPTTLVQSSGDTNLYSKTYISMLNSTNQHYEETGDMSLKVLAEENEDPFVLRHKYIVGASFDPVEGPIAWFSNEPLHALPLSLQLLLNSLTGPDLQIEFVNYPITDQDTDFDAAIQANMTSASLLMGLTAAVAFIGSFYILFSVRERKSQAKHLQFVSGINVFIYWFVSFLSDLITYLVSAIALVATYAAMQPSGLSSVFALSSLFLLLFSFGLAVIPFMYLFSFIFSIPSTGYARMFILSFAVGYPSVIVMQVLKQLDSPYASIRYGLMITPQYELIDATSKVLTVDKCSSSACGNDTHSTCCAGLYSFEDGGISMSLIYIYLIGLVCFLLVCTVDLKLISILKYKLFYHNKKPEEPSFVDDDVRDENQKVHRTPIPQLQSEYVLVLKDLTKNYKKKTAVNGINLTVKPSECFGLLGVNGAGKTTTFKMMTGDVMISYGDGWVNRLSIKSQMGQVYKYIGYCPQFDALLDDLTARETLKIFSLIRGVPNDECQFLAQKLAKDFDFTQHLDKQVKQLSGGNKRKLSTAIALIGDAPILFLDEPTTGMDPGTKRHLWNQLSKICESGKSIILTSHSMEECEALCTRLAIMVNGNFQCLGSIQHLKSKFAEGVSVSLKIKKLPDSSGLEHADTSEIENFMARHFANAELKEKHQELLNYFIKSRSTKWSQLFAVLEDAKRHLNVEDYSVGQASLEQVFLTFTKNQKGDEDTPETKSKSCFCGMCCC